MKITLLIMAVWLLGMTLGAIAHERDIYNNLNKYGNAHAWTCEIVSAEMKGKP